MTERLGNGQKPSGIGRFISRLQQLTREKIDRRKKHDERVFYNEDHTKKYVFGYADYNNPNYVCEYMHLYAVTPHRELSGKAESYSRIFTLIKRGHDKKASYIIDLDVIIDNPYFVTETFYYDTQGYLREGHTYTPPRKGFLQEDRQLLLSRGCYRYSELPKRIDYENTAKLFLTQVKNLDFKTPQLIPYDSQTIGDQNAGALATVES